MKVLVTGATGFVGTHLVRRLAQSDYELRCLVRQSSRTDELRRLGATLVPGDVTNRASVRRSMDECEWVINLANLYSFWEPDRRVFWRVNVEGTRNVMECALEAGVSKVVHVSSAGIFGKPVDCPFTENSEVGPERFSDYTRTKYEGDRVAWELHEQRKLPLVMIYPGVILGPGDTKSTGQYVRQLVERRLPARVFDATVFTFVHVRDVVEAIVRAAEKEGNIGEKYLVGHYRHSWLEFSRLICEVASVPLPRFRMPDAMVFASAALLTLIADLTKKPPLWGMSRDAVAITAHGFQFDGSKAARELGITYTPLRVTLEEAIASLRADRNTVAART